METPPKKNVVFRWIDFTSDLGGMLSAACLGIIALIIGYEVFMRYLFSAPTTWVAEMSVYLCMAVGLLGAGFALKNNSHFSITILIDRFSPKNRRRMQILTNLIGLCYSMVFIYKGASMAKFTYDIQDVSTGLMAVPLWIPWLLVPTGGVLLTLQFINKLSDEILKQK